MKKLFLAFMVLSAFVLASCGSKDMSYRNGDVSFSISGSEVGRYLAARDVNGSQDNTIEFAILAQIKGSKGYQAWQMGKAYYTPGTDSVVVETDAEAGDLPEQIQTHVESLRFPFKHIPANQTYTVMVDVFKKEDKPDPFPGAWRVSLSGEKSAVKVRAGSSTPVTLELYGTDMQPNNFALKVSYSKNNKTQSELVSLDEDFRDKYKFAKDDKNIWFSHAGREWHSLTGFKLVLDSSSHFSKGADFSLVQNDPTAATEGDLKFGKKVVAQASKGEIDLLPMCLVKEEGSDNGLHKTIELDFEGIVLYQNLDLDIGVEKENFGSFEIYEQQYKFAKDETASTADKGRFVMTIPLEDIFGEDPLEKGDSIAFPVVNLAVYAPDSLSSAIPITNLAYQFQKAGWEKLDSTARYENNTTIDVNAGNQSYGDIQSNDVFVFTANFIDGDEKYLQLYTDLGGNYASKNELMARLTIKYRVFPASDKVYVFHNSFASWSEIRVDVDTGDQMEVTIKDYRKEMILDINDCFEKAGKWPATGRKITLSVGGTFHTLSSYDEPVLEQEEELKAELYDNIDYSGCTTEGHNSYYHTLSNSSSNNSGNNGNFNELTIGEDGTLGSIIFNNITEVHPVSKHKYRLQLYKSLGQDPANSNDQLLIIKNFSISADVQAGSSNPEVSAEDIGN